MDAALLGVLIMFGFEYFYNKVKHEAITQVPDERGIRNLKREGIKLSSQKE